MEKILADFGVQPVYLAAQAVNFIVLLLILKKFLYGPILKVLEERKSTVSDTLIKAEQIEAKLHTTEQESEIKLQEVSKQARIILYKASMTADQIITEAHEKAQADVEIIIEQGKETIVVEREKMKTEMREELADLVLLGIEKIAGKVLDQRDHMKIVDQTIEGLKGDISSKV